MIVPRNRLLFWAGLVLVPIALFAAVMPAAGPICLLIVGSFALAVCADAWRARHSLAGIGIELPAVTRMSKDREGKLEVRIRNELSRSRT